MGGEGEWVMEVRGAKREWGLKVLKKKYGMIEEMMRGEVWMRKGCTGRRCRGGEEEKIRKEREVGGGGMWGK